MKRIKKSIKIVIALSCVFLLAVVGVVTALIVNNSDENNPNNPESGYVLTAGQKLLVSEINSNVNTAVSNSHGELVDYTFECISAGDVEFFNDSIVWSGSSQKGYKAYFVDSLGTEYEFIEKFISDKLGVFKTDNSITTSADNLDDFEICYITNNFVVLNYHPSISGSYENYFIFVCVENHQMNVVKSIKYIDNGGAFVDGHIFSIAFGDEFFAYLTFDNGFRYEFFEYKNSYENYDSYKYPSSGSLSSEEASKGILIEGSIFYTMEDLTSRKMLLVYNGIGDFSLANGGSLNNTISAKKANIVITKIESSSLNSNAEKIDEKYYNYSYSYRKNDGTEKSISLGSFHKIYENLVYSSDNYFAIFMQKIENNVPTQTGQIVYYDYDLNVIASYSASSSQDVIKYSSGESILTTSGLYLTKNSENLTISYNFENNGYKFVDVLSNGNFVLSDTYNNIAVYNFGMACLSSNFDELIVKIDDENVIFKASGEYFIYNLKNKTSSCILFENTKLTSATGLYFVKTSAGSDTYSLIGNEEPLKNVKYVYNLSNSSLVITLSNGEKKSYFVKGKTSVSTQNVSIVVSEEVLVDKVVYVNAGIIEGSVSNTAIGGSEIIGGEGAIEGGGGGVNHSGNFNSSSVETEPEDYYDYSDKLIYKDEDEAGNPSYRLVHYITDGFYSKEASMPYIDYLELHYTGENSGGLATYIPFRIYYQVTIDDGNPKVDILAYGHIYVAAMEKGTDDKKYSGLNTITTSSGKVYYVDELDKFAEKDRENGWTISYSKADVGNYLSYDSVETKYGGAYRAFNYDFVGSSFETLELSASVYGNSIKVSTFMRTYPSVSLTSWSFGQNKVEDILFKPVSAVEGSVVYSYEAYTDGTISTRKEDYYNKLYYRTVIVGAIDSSVNIDEDLIKKDNGDFKILSDEWVSKIAAEANTKLDSNKFLEIKLEGTGSTSLLYRNKYFATISNKTYYSKGSQDLYFGSNLKLDIVGGKLVGITTLNNLYTKPNNAIYNTETETYNPNAVEFRVRGDGGINVNVDSFSALKYSVEDSYYYMSIVNNSYFVYYGGDSGGLLKDRYVYCVYEPQIYNVEFDYNIASTNDADGGENVGIDSEIDYLQNYAGITIGNSSSLTQISYTKTWAYKNVANSSEFTSSTNINKYQPLNFHTDLTRTNIEESDYENYEYPINDVIYSETIVEDFKAYYVTIDGVKYYFQYIRKGESDSFKSYFSRNGDYLYFKAYSNFENLKAVSSGISKFTDDSYFDTSNSYYLGKENVYLKVTRISANEFKFQYRSYNFKPRMGNYEGNYQYIAGEIQERTGPLSVTESFRIHYSDDVILSSNPTHIHYNFVGWRLYYNDTDYLLISPTSDELKSGFNINPYLYKANNLYLAGNAGIENWRDYHSSWEMYASSINADGSIDWKCESITSSSYAGGYYKNSKIRLVAEWMPIDCSVDAILWTQSDDYNGGAHMGLELKSTLVGEYYTYSFDELSLSRKTTIPHLYAGPDDIDNYNGAYDGKMTRFTFKYDKNKTFLDIGKELYNSGYRDGSIQSNNISARFAGWAIKYTDDKYYSIVQSVVDLDAKDYSDSPYYGYNPAERTIAESIGDTAVLTIYAYYLPSGYDFDINLNSVGGAQYDLAGKNYFTSGRVFNNESAAAIFNVVVADSDNIKTTREVSTDDEGITFLNNKYKINIFDKFFVNNSIKISVKVKNDQDGTQIYYLKKLVISNLTLLGDDGKYHKYTITFLKNGNSWNLETIKDESGNSLNFSDEKEYYIFGGNATSKDYNFGTESIAPHNKLLLTSGDDGTISLTFQNLSNPGTIVEDNGNQFFEGKTGFSLEVFAESYTISNEKVTIKVDEDGKFEYNSATLTATQSISDIKGFSITAPKTPYVWIGGVPYQLSSYAWDGMLSSGYYKIFANKVAEKLEDYTYKDFIEQEISKGGDMVVYYDRTTYLVHYPVQFTYYNENKSETKNGTLNIDYNNTRVLIIAPEQTNNFISTKPEEFYTANTVFELTYYLSSLKIGEVTFLFNPIVRTSIRDGSKLSYSLMSMEFTGSSADAGKIYSISEYETAENKAFLFMGSDYIINDAFKITMDTTGKNGAEEYYLYLCRTSAGETKYFLIYDEKPSEAKTDLSSNFPIEVEFNKLQKTLIIEANESDLYKNSTDYSKSDSLNIEYSYNLKGKKYNNYEYDKKGNAYTTKDSLLNYAFASNSNSKTLYLSSETDYTRSWLSAVKFYPSDTVRYTISAKSGYIIDSIKIYVGNLFYPLDADDNPQYIKYDDSGLVNIMSFEIDPDISFERLAYYATGNLSYTSIDSGDVLQSRLVYKIKRTVEEGDESYNTNLGYDLLNKQLGLLYSYNEKTNWSYDDEDTYTLDQLFLLVSGMYEDVKIVISTTSYAEWIFQNGETDESLNPLIKHSLTKETGYPYSNIDFLDTYLNVYVYNKITDNDGNIIDDSTINVTDDSLKLTDENGDKYNPYILRYYIDDSVDGLKSGTIRLIFYGSGHIINDGLKFIATEDDYSAYFTNGRYYNESNGYEDGGRTKRDTFKQLEAFSGRTNINETITVDKKKNSNKLVYMFTGEIYNDYFKNSELIGLKYDIEFNVKYLVAVTTYKNTINTETSSYLYNDNISRVTDFDSVDKDNFIADGGDVVSNDYYGFVGDNIFVTKYDTENLLAYQLDDKNKTQSWFNNTILSNIQYNYNSNIKNWVNRDRSNNNISELSSVDMTGLDFNWHYYEIAGYYLQYIIVYVEDLGKYIKINVQSLLNAYSPFNEVNGTSGAVYLGSFEVDDTTNNGYKYTFSLFYELVDDDANLVGGCFKLYPLVLNTDNDGNIMESNSDSNYINWLESISIVSNNIKVAFLSNAYTYTIAYSAYDYRNISTSISTWTSGITKNNDSSQSGFGGILEQTIYYDSMVKINSYQEMDGYTFIGWGSQNYYNDSSFYSRFTDGSSSKAATWNTSAVWYNVAENYFAKEGKTGFENCVQFDYIYDKYRDIPKSSYYTPDSYFLTDTGNSSTENYNFYSQHIDLFGCRIGQSLNTEYTMNYIYLYGLFKANTYAVQFKINNTCGDDYKISIVENSEWTYNPNWLDNSISSDGLTFRIMRTVGNIVDYYTGYVTFDTNDWFYLTRANENTLQYSIFFDDGPYEKVPMVQTNDDDKKISTLVADMFGYSFLGWYYTQKANVQQSASYLVNSRILNSYYLNKKGQGTTDSLPVFNKVFLDGNVEHNEVSTPKIVYYGEHKAVGASVSTADGYIYYYSYAKNELLNTSQYSENNTTCNYESGRVSIEYTLTYDYLNNFIYNDDKIEYEELNNYPILLSFFDTCLGANCYGQDTVSGQYQLKLNRDSKNLRTVTLYAAWSENEYNTVVDFLDTDGKVEQIGSTSAEWLGRTEAGYKYTTFGYFYYNDQNLAKRLTDVANIPIKIGYDFVGWGFSYVNSKTQNYTDYISSINSESSVLYLCKELLAKYSFMSSFGGENSNEYSTILMTTGRRLPNSLDTEWLLNGNNDGETYGDREEEVDRCVYIFPIWKAQTYSVNISLNIAKEDLKNLYDKDSSFALGFYKDGYNDFVGITSKFYTYDNSGSNAEYYYNDVVANIYFEIEFDKPISTASLRFNGETYTLKDLFATSAGYYFLGLMSEQTDDYIVRNTLNSYLQLNDGLTNGNAIGKSDLENNDLIFDLDLYKKLHSTKHSNDNVTNNITNSTLLTNNDYGDYSEKDNSKLANSSNFGSIKFASIKDYAGNTIANSTHKVISEYVNGEYYLYILVNCVRYYVVYYQIDNSMRIQNTIVSDKTRLYYCVKNQNGEITNKYVISFDLDGNPYYVENGFKNKITLNLCAALYLDRTNTLRATTNEGLLELSLYALNNTEGSLFVWRGNKTVEVLSSPLSSAGSTATLEFYNSREFTLYADWEIREITTQILNGNNNSSADNKYIDNPGLAGAYHMHYYNTKGDDDDVLYTSSTTGATDNGLELENTFYYTNELTFLPFYNGRYMSEMVFEFDSLKELNRGLTSEYSMEHNTLSIKFLWNNKTQTISISYIYLNGNNVSGGFNTNSNAGYVANMFNISKLSLISQDSMKSNGSMLIYERGSYGFFNINNSAIKDTTRYDVNKIYFSLVNIMTSLKITCKYSVQTYDLEVYSIGSREDLVSIGTKSQTVFSSYESMMNSTIYSYIAKNSYSNVIMSTMSTDCATGSVTIDSYNVPYGYIPTDFGYVSLSVPDGRAFDEFNYSAYYFNGSSTTAPLLRYSNESNYSLNYIKQDTMEINTTYKEGFKGWFTYEGNQSGGYLQLEQYNAGQTPVTSNTTIYGYFKAEESTSSRVLFYYWNGDATDGSYIQIQDEDLINDYTFTTVEKTFKLSQLPDPSIAQWCGGKDTTKQFVGYIYLTSDIIAQLTNLTNTSYESYNSSEEKASTYFKDTSGDIWSAINKGVTTVNGATINSSTNGIKDIINSLSKISFLRYRFEVADNTYYVKQDGNNDKTVNGYNILDGARFSVAVPWDETDKFYIYKDFHFLNIDTELPTGQDIYAIPIYDEIKLQIVGANAKQNTVNGENSFTITNDTNMIVSNVFKTSSEYTYYFSPNMLKLAYTTGNQTLTKDDLQNESEFVSESGNKIYSFSKNGEGDDLIKVITLGIEDGYKQDIGVFKINNIDESFTIAVYYVNQQGVIEMVSNSIFVEPVSRKKATGARLNITSSDKQDVSNDAKVYIYDSPIDIELDEGNKQYYERACDIIEAQVPENSEHREDEIINRKLIVLITLQLMQIKDIFNVDTILDEYTDREFYYIDKNADPSAKSVVADGSANGGLFSIQSGISVLNKFIYNLDTGSSFNINTMGFYRLVYSLAYYYLYKENNLHIDYLGYGLESLYGNNKDYIDNFNGKLDDIIELRDESDETWTPLSGVLPGDLLLDNRSTKYYDVINVVNTDSNSKVYFVEANIDVSMYLYDDESNIYVNSATSLYAAPISQYNEQEYQNAYTYRHFMVKVDKAKNPAELYGLNVTVDNSKNGIVYASTYNNLYYALNMGIELTESKTYQMASGDNFKPIISYDTDSKKVYLKLYDATKNNVIVKRYDFYGGYVGDTKSVDYSFDYKKFTVNKGSYPYSGSTSDNTKTEIAAKSFISNTGVAGYYYGAYTINGEWIAANGTDSSLYKYVEGIIGDSYKTNAETQLSSDAVTYANKCKNEYIRLMTTYLKDVDEYNKRNAAGNDALEEYKTWKQNKAKYDQYLIDYKAWEDAGKTGDEPAKVDNPGEWDSTKGSYEREIYIKAYNGFNYTSTVTVTEEITNNSENIYSKKYDAYIADFKEAYLAAYEEIQIAEHIQNHYSSEKYSEPTYKETAGKVNTKQFSSNINILYEKTDLSAAYFEIWDDKANGDGYYLKKILSGVKIVGITVNEMKEWLTAAPTNYFGTQVKVMINDEEYDKNVVSGYDFNEFKSTTDNPAHYYWLIVNNGDRIYTRYYNAFSRKAVS